MSSDRIGIALFGLGRAGSIHAPNVLTNSRAKLLYIVEEDVEKVKTFLEVKNAYHVKVISAENVAVIWEDKSVVAVMVCTPTATHEKLVMDALDAGKAVFCEKPLSNNVEATGSELLLLL